MSDGMKKKDGEVYETDRDGRIVIPVNCSRAHTSWKSSKPLKAMLSTKEPQQFKVDGKTASITLEQKGYAAERKNHH